MLNNHLISFLKNYSRLYLVGFFLISFFGCASRVSSDVFTAKINEKRDLYEQCYQIQIKANDRPELRGNLLLSFYVNNQGDVLSSELLSDYWMLASFKRCLLGILNKTKFPNYKGPKRRVVRAINFYPGGLL